jgi:FKBP-type peptidyl-prolyl cis-trans isomerase FkpA
MSVTTVPIQPIKKGSLLKYWVGTGLVLAVAGGLAYWGTADERSKYNAIEAVAVGKEASKSANEALLAANAKAAGVETTASGLQFKVIKAGEGPSPTNDDVALLGYRGTLRDGSVFDENPQAPMPVAGVVPGFSEALKKMQRGGQYKIWIPSKIGYGDEDQKNPQTGAVVLPGGSVLIFDIQLLDFISRKKFEEGMAKQQAAHGGGAGGAAANGQPADGAPQGLPPEIQAQLEQQMRGQGR